VQLGSKCLSLTGSAIASSRTKFDGVTSAVMIFEAAGCRFAVP
jgi:hypothetical protein